MLRCPPHIGRRRPVAFLDSKTDERFGVCQNIGIQGEVEEGAWRRSKRTGLRAANDSRKEGKVDEKMHFVDCNHS
jgi:hypothetical protein